MSRRGRRSIAVCAEPGCPALVARGRCEAHERDHRARALKRPSARALGYDKRWERTRRQLLEAMPWCNEDGCDQLATEVHHIDGLGPLGPRGHDFTNLEPLCKPHHSARTNRDRASR